jgi:hypothetical protein
MSEQNEAALQSLRMICAGASEGLVALSWKGPAKTATLMTEYFGIDELPRAADFALAVAPHSHVWAASGLLSERPIRGRGSAADVASIGHFSLDFDVGTEGHAVQKSRPENKDDIFRLLSEPRVPGPTQLVDTGNGLLVVWVLEEPLIIASEADRHRAENFFKGFQGQIRRTAKSKFGWDLDNTADLARLVRVAGTLNHKTAPPKPVVAFGPDRDPTHRLSTADLTSLSDTFFASTARQAKPASTASHVPVDGEPHPLDCKSKLETVVAGCAFMDHWCHDGAELTEPEWKAGIDIAVRCADSREQIHAASQPHSGYSVSETDAKIDRALAGPPPRTCRNIETEVGFEGCALCPFRGKINSPIVLGHAFGPMVALGRRYVYVAKRDAFFDLAGPR